MNFNSMHVIIIQYSILESSVTMNFSFLPKYLPYFNYGAVVTVLISICVVFLGTILGVVLAFGQRSKFKPLVWLANLYVWIFRGTPMMVQIMIAFALMHINAPTIHGDNQNPWNQTRKINT